MSFAYDNAGWRALLTLPDRVTQAYGYDVDSHVTSLTDKHGNASIGNLTYGGACPGRSRRNALGRRVSKTVDGTTTKFLGACPERSRRDGLNPVQELNGSNGVIANMLTGLNIDEYPSASLRAGFERSEPGCCGPLSYLNDALGSTLALTDSSGTVQNQYQYEPFGNAFTPVYNNTSTNSYQFTGRENDGESGYDLDYYRGRYYSPLFQRFVSQDPIAFAGGDTNLYAYAFNAPIFLYDPFGLAWGDWHYVRASREGAPQTETSYGFDTTADPFAALPAENMQGSQIEVEADGRVVVLRIGDVGPWNGGHTRSGRSLDDPYWDTNSPPQATCGTDLRHRITNRSGLDLSDEAIRELGLDPDSGLYNVRWRGLPSDMASPDASEDQARDLLIHPRLIPHP